MKRKRIVVCGIVMTALTVLSSTGACAASKKSKAVKAYQKMLSGRQVKWAENIFVRADSCSFALAYIDNDSVPELILRSYEKGTRYGYYAVYTYKGGKAQYVVNTGIEIGYAKKKGVIYGANYFTVPQGGPGDYECYYKMAKGAVSTGYSKDTRGKTSYAKETLGKKYSSSKISAGTYKKKVKSLMGSKKLVKSAKIKLYPNTAANRTSKLK